MVSPLDVWTTFSAVRERGPLVHNITNYVAMDLSANALLAAGASPAMVHAQDEAADFARIADAVVINIGTLSPPWVEAMHDAAGTAAERGIPWILDPVGVGATPYRTKTATDLLDRNPSVVRGNASEILALAGAAAGGKGVDSTHEAADAADAARELAARTGGIVAVTGVADLVTDGRTVVTVYGGHPLMSRITALGCAASALVGAFNAVEADRLMATAAALAVLGLAGERAAADSPGPGTLRLRILDELHTLDRPTVHEGARLVTGDQE
ncbi:MAG TPA: hydroxyethylthiazole kinase [Jiangellaceae bacterium]|nr:hydroxyethylthiazole kinase [Jiangellaceae bacterium]